MLEVTAVTKLYGRATGVRDVSFGVAPGEIVGLLGPNGAGKTTIMRVVTGFLTATAGTVKVAGFDVVDQPLQARRHLGYLPEQPPVYPDMTVASYLDFVAQVREVPARERRARIGSAIEQLDLSSVSGRLIGNLSKGYRQRVGLAQALVHDPPLLVLDEPSSSLDPGQTVEMRNIVRRLGETRAVLLSSHILAEVERICARVVILKQGRVVAADRMDRLTRLLAVGTKLRIQVRGKRRDVDSVLAKVPKLESWELEDAGEDVVVGHLHPSSGADIRETLFFRLAEAGYPLLEVRPEVPGLESVFMELTGGAMPAHKPGKSASRSGVEVRGR
ncbi:MAG: ABC transporter ATP-binding protein [Bacillota bacterium]|nr:MAG: ABC transporter ATP-binding protein [Bacillota bacterium]